MSVSQRRELEIERRRDTILDAAEAMFAEHGLHATQMKHIAAKAQLGKGTLYLYFRNKEELLIGVGVRRQGRLLDSFERIIGRRGNKDAVALLACLFGEYSDRMCAPHSGFRLVVSRWADGRKLDTSCEQSSSLASNVQRLFGLVCGVIAAGQDEGTIRRDMTPARLAIQLWSSVNGGLLLQLQMKCLGELAPVDQMPGLDALIRVALDVLRPPALATRSAESLLAAAASTGGEDVA